MGIPGIGRRPVDRHDDHEDDAANRSTRAPARGAPPCTAAGDSYRDQAVIDACRNATPAPRNDRILYVGVNSASWTAEEAALRASASVASIHAASGAAIDLDGQRHPLLTAADVAAFAHTFAEKHGFGPEREEAIVRALMSTPPSGRDELARIALAWAPAENGASIPSRLVVSGHHGDTFFGDGSELDEGSLRALAEALPKAAAQVEDIHLSGCNTEGRVTDAPAWRAAFPNLKTMWGYSGTAPLAPGVHLAAWERATRGRTDALDPRTLAPHQHAVAWSAKKDLVGNAGSLEERRDAATRSDVRFEQWMTGDRPVRGYDALTANDDYTAYRQLAAARGASPEEAAHATARAGAMLRLRYYEKGVRRSFALEHGSSIARACTMLGLAPPALETMSRKEALAARAAFEARVATMRGPLPPEIAEARAAFTGLAKLDPAVVKEEWCH